MNKNNGFFKKLGCMSFVFLFGCCFFGLAYSYFVKWQYEQERELYLEEIRDNPSQHNDQIIEALEQREFDQAEELLSDLDEAYQSESVFFERHVDAELINNIVGIIERHLEQDEIEVAGRIFSIIRGQSKNITEIETLYRDYAPQISNNLLSEAQQYVEDEKWLEANSSYQEALEALNSVDEEHLSEEDHRLKDEIISSRNEIALNVAQEEQDDLDASTAWSNCKRFAKNKLRSPSTAQFAPLREVRGGITDVDGFDGEQEWFISGWVDGENAFGATIRNNVSCRLTSDGGRNFTVTSATVR